jgi:hypothetical protein
MLYLLLFLLLIINSHTFTFLYPSVSLDILTINKPATYTFFANRQYDIDLNPTNYTNPVPANSKIIIMFPTEYNLA